MPKDWEFQVMLWEEFRSWGVVEAGDRGGGMKSLMGVGVEMARVTWESGVSYKLNSKMGQYKINPNELKGDESEYGEWAGL